MERQLLFARRDESSDNLEIHMHVIHDLEMRTVRHVPLFTMFYCQIVIEYYEDLAKVGYSVAEVTEMLFEIYFSDLYVESTQSYTSLEYTRGHA